MNLKPPDSLQLSKKGQIHKCKRPPIKGNKDIRSYLLKGKVRQRSTSNTGDLDKDKGLEPAASGRSKLSENIHSNDYP